MRRLAILEPCGEDWSAMTPAGRGRFCASCRETVVDLSGLRRSEAERLVRSGEVRCAQLALDERGSAVWAPEPAGTLARLGVAAAIALASGCSAEQAGEPVGDAAAEVDDAAEGTTPEDAEARDVEPLGIGAGSLLTGHGDPIPIAPPRVPSGPTVGPSLGVPTVPTAAPSVIAPVSNRNVPAVSSTRTPPQQDLAPPVHHLRGRVGWRR